LSVIIYKQILHVVFNCIIYVLFIKLSD